MVSSTKGEQAEDKVSKKGLPLRQNSTFTGKVQEDNRSAHDELPATQHDWHGATGPQDRGPGKPPELSPPRLHLMEDSVQIPRVLRDGL